MIRIRLVFFQIALFAIFLCGTVQAEEVGQWRKTELDGIDIAYLEAGKPEAQTLVFIPGWSCDSSFWAEQIPVFAKDYHVIAIDLPGFGRSGKPQDIAYTLPLFARAVQAVVTDSKSDKPVLIGHSMGYAVARQYLIMFPQTVKAVVNLDGAYLTIPEEPEAKAVMEKELAKILAAHEGPNRPEAVKEFITSSFYDKTSQPMRDKIMKAMSSADSYAATSALREMFRIDQWQEQSFDVPSLAIYATHAFLPPDHRAYIKKVFPQVVYIEWTDTGHFLMMEQPERFNKAVKDYLNDLS